MKQSSARSLLIVILTTAGFPHQSPQLPANSPGHEGREQYKNYIISCIPGLGFAGALSEIGVPQHEVPLALLMFNVGVETGQLLFIAVVLSLFQLLRRLPVTVPQGAWHVLPYSIGSVAAFWTIDRVMSFLPFSVWG